jgi:DnaK suppressor protein
MTSDVPASELTPAQKAELAQHLAALLQELEAQLARGEEGARAVPLDQSAVGRLSRMDSIQHQAMAQAARRNLEIRVGQCRQALGALERGDYGRCRLCEEPIGYARLVARPETPFCLACQRGSDRG